MTLPLATPAGSKDSLVGTRLNGFVITAPISVGGMGVVYEARHPLIGKRAAVKVIRPEFCNNADLSARFLREARAVSAVKHRNVVEILDFGALPDGAQYMMMEFLEGDTLAQVIARDAPLQPCDALQICEEILSALSAAHQEGVVHRDLKPANIVLMKQSSGELIVKVLDFGLARHLDTAPEPTTRESLHMLSLEKSSLLAGTPEYISPEQASGEQVGAQGDLYCLGVILYEMLSGRLPFTATSPWELMQQHRLVTPPPLSAVGPGIPGAVCDFVMKLLKKDPAERPLGAKEAGRTVAQLKGFLSNSRISDPSLMGALGSGPARSRKSQVLAGAAFFAAFAAVGLLFFVGATHPVVAQATVATIEPFHPVPPPVPATEPAPERAAPVWNPPIAPVPRPTAVTLLPSGAGRPPAPVASSFCESNASWKRATREQVEDLEKLSLSRMKDDARPSDVAKVKLKARNLAASLKNAQGRQCQQVEAQLVGWRKALR